MLAAVSYFLIGLIKSLVSNEHRHVVVITRGEFIKRKTPKRGKKSEEIHLFKFDSSLSLNGVSHNELCVIQRVHEKTLPLKYNGVVFEILGKHH